MADMASRRLGVLRPMLIGAIVSAGCGPPSGRPAGSQKAQSVPILEEVLRYELQQFVDKAQEPPGTVVCLAIVNGQRVLDPPGDLLARLNRGPRVSAKSRCATPDAIELTAGPIHWVSETEARVAGTFRKEGSGLTPLTYRVVFEAGRWSCLGPIIDYDPL